MIDKLHLFFQSYEIWGGAIAAGAIAGVVCGFLGVYVVLNRIVFVSAAMAQVSSLGVMIAFWYSSHLDSHAKHAEDGLPLFFAVGFTLIFSAFLARERASASQRRRGRSSESVIGFFYIVASALVVLVSDRVSQGSHDVANLLFGNAVIVDSTHFILLAASALPILALHIWLFKDVYFASYDPLTARSMGYPVALLQMFLLVSLGIVISIATRTIGALPIFAFSILPAMFALSVVQGVRLVFFTAAILGGISATGGYVASFMLSFPTGACMAAFAGAAAMVALFLRFLRRNA